MSQALRDVRAKGWSGPAVLGRPRFRAVPDQRLGRDVDVAGPHQCPLLRTDPPKDGVIHGDRLEDGPDKEIGQVTLYH